MTFTISGHPDPAERTVPPRAQGSFDLEELFGEHAGWGIVSVSSETPVALSWQQTARVELHLSTADGEPASDTILSTHGPPAETAPPAR